MENRLITRRELSFLGAGAAIAATSLARAADSFATLEEKFATLEKASGGRLGVAVLDTKTGRTASYRGDERFPITSTFKLLAASAVLAQVDAGKSALERIVMYSKADLVPYSPATSAFADKGMRLDAICEAAITLSDNTAGNLLLREIGGPDALTSFARRLGDAVTRLDRWETALNEAVPGDERDTTSPRAMIGDVGKLALGDTLTPPSREKLTGWMKNCKTSADRMKSSLPAGWVVGDKTGAGERGTMNDVGLIWPPDGAPILLAIYLTNTERTQPERAAIHAEVGRLVAAAARP